MRWIAHCVSMWSCFSLAYYCMDLVAIVGVTEWAWWQQAIAHTLLVTPHLILTLRLSPAVIKYESLLSCVVRRVDEMVATVVHHMERTNRVCETLRSRVVDAHKQELEAAAPRDGGRGTPSDTSEGTQERKRQLSQHFHSTVTAETGGSRMNLGSPSSASMLDGEISDVQLSDSIKWLYNKISRGDKEITLRRLRVGLHKINAYFTEKDWAMLCRLLDRDRTRKIEVCTHATVTHRNKDAALGARAVATTVLNQPSISLLYVSGMVSLTHEHRGMLVCCYLPVALRLLPTAESSFDECKGTRPARRAGYAGLHSIEF